MKGLKEFLELLKENEGLKAEVNKVQNDTAKVVEIAKSHGYEFTEDEFNDLRMAAVSGGTAGEDAVNWLNNFINSPDFDKKVNDLRNLLASETNRKFAATAIDTGINYFK